jgi:hypothetical protein
LEEVSCTIAVGLANGSTLSVGLTVKDVILVVVTLTLYPRLRLDTLAWIHGGCTSVFYFGSEQKKNARGMKCQRANQGASTVPAAASYGEERAVRKASKRLDVGESQGMEASLARDSI